MTRRMPWSSIVLFVALAYAITWLAWLPGMLQHKSIFSLSIPLTLLGGMGPAISAVITTAVMERREGLAWLGRRLVKWRVPFRWYLVALLLPLCSFVVAMAAGLLQGGTFAGLSLPGGVGLLSAYLMQTLLTGGNEELGWRGFALPALQARFGAFAASIVLAIIWAVWHLPLFFMEGTSQSHTSFALFLLFTIPLTVVISWLHNQTGGSILLVMLFHGAFNTTANFVRISPFGTESMVVWMLLAAAIVIVSGPKRLVRRQERLSDAA